MMRTARPGLVHRGRPAAVRRAAQPYPAHPTDSRMSGVFETTDLESAEQVLSDRYAKMRVDGRDPRGGMRLTQASLIPAVRLDHVRFAMSFTAEVDPLGTLIVASLVSGRAAHGSGGERRYRAGQVYLVSQPEHPYTTMIEDVDGELAVLDPALPSLVADTTPGRSQQPVRLTSCEPVSPHAARRWQDTYAYIRDTVLAIPEAAAQPLIAASAARLLVAVTLDTFPSNTLTDPTIEDRHDAHPATLRRAVEFIDENAQRDITVADIAAAGFVTIRTVQLAFRRHLDSTPMRYLRQVRLAHAHDELNNANPAATTVTAIAYRWGFSNASRFGTLYRKAYGVTPSQTLHHD
jgi:AraC-like DNA-binding protein